MATTRLMPLHTGKGRTVGQAISDIIDYTENPQKTDGGRLITSWQCDSRIADAEFLFTKNQYIQKTGRVRGEDNVIAYHLRQSFVPGEITPEDANRLGCELAKRFTKGNHAYIVCTHIDKAHIHNHVIWNSTALSQTRKFRNFWGSSRAVRRLNDTICIENGCSIVENPKRHGKSYNKWLGDKKKPSHRERICAATHDALAQTPVTFEALLERLRQAGVRTAVVSNKPDRTTRTLAAQFFPELDGAMGQREGLASKPAPDLVRAALDQLHAAPEETLYVGDSEVDVATARNAGLDMIGVAWGFRGRAALEAAGAPLVADTPEQLLDMLQ